MELSFFVIWLLLVVVYPIALFGIANSKYVNGDKFGKTGFQFFQAFIAYLLLTVVAFLAIIMAVVTPDPRSDTVSFGNHDENKIFYYAVILIYLAAGWLLCCFVSGNIVKPWEIFKRNTEKPQSIFDAD